MADKAYTDESKIEKFLDKSITTGDANDFILATQKFIDEYTSRNFKADTSAVERFFCGKDSDLLTIDDCVSITKVEVSSDFYGDSFQEIEAFVQGTNSSGYITLPSNNDEDEVPIRQLLLRSYNFVSGVNNVKITAKWGWSTTPPDDISFAATIIAAGMYQYNRGGASGNVKSEKIGNYSISYNNEKEWSNLERAKNILDQYKKINL